MRPVAKPTSPAVTADTAKSQKNRMMRIVGWITGVAGAVFLLTALLVVAYRYDNLGWSQSISSTLHLPAVMVGSDIIPYGDFLREAKLTQRYYEYSVPEAQRTAETAPTRAMIVDSLVQKSIIYSYAKKNNISVSAEDLDKTFATLAESAGLSASDAAEFIQGSFGIDLATYKNDVIRPDALRTKIVEKLTSDEAILKVAKDKADVVYAKLQNKEGSFEELAASSSDDQTSAGQNGEIGYFTAETIPEAVRTEVLGLQEGANTGVIYTPGTYAIIKMVDRIPKGEKYDGETVAEEEMYKLSGIFFFTQSFDEWMQSQKEATRVITFIRNTSGGLNLLQEDERKKADDAAANAGTKTGDVVSGDELPTNAVIENGNVNTTGNANN